MAQVKSSLPAIYGDHPGSGELNLGDNGTLYVFDSTAIMQCY